MERSNNIWLTVILGIIGACVTVYSVAEGLIAHDIIVPSKGSTNFYATGEDAVLAGWVYLIIGLVFLGAAIAAWRGDLDDLFS